VSNVPFNVTTPVLRHLLAAPGWEPAVLIIQWEVARKRAGVGRVFNSPGRGLVDILARRGLPRPAARELCRRAGYQTGGLPRDLTARDWIQAFRVLNVQAAPAEPHSPGDGEVFC
jgi:hypothetical protein